MKSRRSRALLYAVGVIAIGLVWRLAPLHLPAFAFKYGGSMLYAAMLYWLTVAVLPRARVSRVALLAVGLAFAIETFKLVHRPALDAFRITLAGKLLLGRVFTFGALLAYFVAVLAMALLDSELGAPPLDFERWVGRHKGWAVPPRSQKRDLGHPP